MIFREYLILVLGLVFVGLSAAGAWLFPASWWGLHLWAFLPRPAFIAALLAVTGFGAWVFLGPRTPLRPAPLEPRSERARSPFVLFGAPLALAIAFGVLAWVFRVRHLLLGDGIPLVQHLPTGLAFHPREPLTYALQAQLFRFFSAVAPGLDPEATAFRAVAAGSLGTGVLFALVAWALAGEISRDRGLANRFLLSAILLTQGYALLFFGYVENYAFLVATAGLFLLLALRAARGAGPLWLPGAAAVLAAAFHISGALLFAAWLVLVLIRIRARGPRVWIDVAAVAALFGVTALLLGRMQSHYNWVDTILTVGRVTTTSGLKGINKSYLGSANHVRDFLNEHWLVGPFALFLVLPAAAAAVLSIRRRRPDAGALFLGANALLWLAVVLRMADSNLGYARDWDLQTTAALSFSVAGLYLVSGRGEGRLTERRFLSLVLVLSLFQFVPWVLVNSSPDRAVRRVAALPLGHGRSEVLVGTFYIRENRLDKAEEWYQKGLKQNIESHAAWCGLACVAFQKRDYARAARLFGVAVKLKPDYPLYRQSLVSTLIHDGRQEEALREFRNLLAVDGRNVTSWMQYAQLLREFGHAEEAREAFRKVLELEPGQTEAARRLEDLESAPVAPDSLAPAPQLPESFAPVGGMSPG
jgi:tetratricopeptide (TPR) repeat protein